MRVWHALALFVGAFLAMVATAAWSAPVHPAGHYSGKIDRVERLRSDRGAGFPQSAPWQGEWRTVSQPESSISEVWVGTWNDQAGAVQGTWTGVGDWSVSLDGKMWLWSGRGFWSAGSARGSWQGTWTAAGNTSSWRVIWNSNNTFASGTWIGAGQPSDAPVTPPDGASSPPTPASP